MDDAQLAAVKAYEAEDCPICGRLQTLHLALTWHTGWHALQFCAACRHIITPGDAWWKEAGDG